MDEPIGGAGAGDVPPSIRRTFAFILFLGVYYVVYYFFFARRLADYFRDLVGHFEFFRRLF